MSNHLKSHTKNWIETVVVGLNLCPFAQHEIKRNSIKYHVCSGQNIDTILNELHLEFICMNEEPSIETTLLIIENSFTNFYDFLDLTDAANQFLVENNFEGVYQLASFHPKYLFENSIESDPANYTNRSPYPMLHILRESSVEAALKNFKNPENIPAANISKLKKLGLAKMQALRNAAMK